jgi:hypothetical protein
MKFSNKAYRRREKIGEVKGKVKSGNWHYLAVFGYFLVLILKSKGNRYFIKRFWVAK